MKSDLKLESNSLATMTTVGESTDGQVPSWEWMFQRRWPVVMPLLFLIGFSVVVRLTDADLIVAGLFFDQRSQSWPWDQAEPGLVCYRWGTIPAMALGIGGAVVALFGRWLWPWSEWRSSRSIRRSGLFLALLLAIGPGLIVNVGLKQLWGRPRPCHCEQFGGTMAFVPVGTWGARPMRNSSFPSGHSSIAFFLMAPGFVVDRQRPRWIATLFLGGTLYGFLMGLARISQGDHFLTDIVWSGAFVYFTGVLLSKVFLGNPRTESVAAASPNTPEKT